MKFAILSALILVMVCFQSKSMAETVRLLQDNQEAFQARLELINQAQTEILAEYFAMADDDLSVGALALLVQAAQRGVEVKIIVDALSSEVPPELVAALLKNGKDAQGVQRLQIKIYNHISLLNLKQSTHRDHAKMLIVDGKQFITGGRNWTDEYFGLNAKQSYRDLDILIDGGTVAQAARESFYQVWQSSLISLPKYYHYRDDRLAPGYCNEFEQQRSADCEETQKQAIDLYRRATVRLQKLIPKVLAKVANQDVNQIIGEVAFLSHQEKQLVTSITADMTNRYLELLLTAKEEVNILTPYLVPTKAMMDVFTQLLARNVKIRLMTNSMNSNNSIFASAGYEDVKGQLIAMGIELYEYQGPETTHAKVAVIDGKISIVGSYNLDYRSAQVNREVGVVVRDEKNAFAKTLTDAIEDFRANAILVGKDKMPQNLDLQANEAKKAGRMKRNLLKIFKFLLPLYKTQT